MKLIDFKYKNEFAFWEYRFQAIQKDSDILPPTPSTMIKRVLLTEKADIAIKDLVVFPREDCIIIITSPFKGTVWETADGMVQRARCYTTVLVLAQDELILRKLDNTNDEMWIIQGDLLSLDYVLHERTSYKKWYTEEHVQTWMQKPAPKYITAHKDNWAISDSMSETTIINHTDAGWWFDISSYADWYNPYVLTWRKANCNILSWRTPSTQAFQFGFENDPKAVAEKQFELIKKYLPKTKRVIYFGQCLGSPFCIATASHYPGRADGLYTTATIFDPTNHRSKKLMELNGTATLGGKWGAMDVIDPNSDLLDRLPHKTQFLFKLGDENERTEHGRFVYLHGAKDNIKHFMVKYTDVYAPVVSTKPYSMFAFLNADHPNTEIDEVFEELSLEETLKHHGG